MNYGPLIFLGAFVSIAASWLGIVGRPQHVIGTQDLVQTLENKQYPTTPPGQARDGASIYRANGCAYCHTRQVRGMESDVPRWGPRRTVAADYLYDQPLMLGTVRIGPDLTNVGLRKPDANWQLVHLYNPKALVEDSVMPPYRYLFDKRPAGDKPSPDALQFPEGFGPEPGFEIIPRKAARELVAFLMNSKVDASLEVAPISSGEEEDESGAAAPAEETAPAETAPPKVYE